MVYQMSILAVYQTLNKLLVKTSGKGEPLIVLHGWGMNSSAWEPVASQLESRNQVSWVDLPGYGMNADIEASSMDEIVNLILDNVADITSSEFHIMGWSLGGLVVQAIAQRVPDIMKSMTLVASTPRFSQSDDTKNPWPHAMSLKVLHDFAENLKQDVTGTLKRFIALQFMGLKNTREIQRKLIREVVGESKSAQKVGGVLSNIQVQSNNQALDLGLQLLAESDFRGEQSPVPQNWLFAGNDRLIPVAVINDLISLRPDAQITLLENAGHAPFMTHPEEFVQHICRFIDGN